MEEQQKVMEEQRKVLDQMKATLTDVTGNQTNVPPVVSAALPSSLYQSTLHPHPPSQSAGDQYSGDRNVSTSNQTNDPPVGTSVLETAKSAPPTQSADDEYSGDREHFEQFSQRPPDEYSGDCNVSAEQLREFSKDPDPPKSNSPGSNTTDVPADFLPADRKDISMAHAKKHSHTAQKIPRFNLPCTHEPSNTDLKLCLNI